MAHSSPKDYSAERKCMVETQLIPRGITDPRVIEAFLKVPRDQFVAPADRALAYGDHPLAIGEGQTISQPYMVALMTQSLRLRGREKVLEIGTGSGYQTAILAELASAVYTIERIEELSARAQADLAALGYTNIDFRVADGTLGWPEEAPFHAIIVTAGAPHVPQPLVDQLAQDGILVIPVGDGFGQDLLRISKRDGRIIEEEICKCVFVRLIGQQGWRA